MLLILNKTINVQINIITFNWIYKYNFENQFKKDKLQ